MRDFSNFSNEGFEELIASCKSIMPDSVTPPPWEFGVNLKLDDLYFKFALELEKTDWEIKFRKNRKPILSAYHKAYTKNNWKKIYKQRLLTQKKNIILNKKLGSYIKGIRIRENLTQKQLEHIIKLPNTYISAIETGRVNISMKLLHRLKKPLNLNLKICKSLKIMKDETL